MGVYQVYPGRGAHRRCGWHGPWDLPQHVSVPPLRRFNCDTRPVRPLTKTRDAAMAAVQELAFEVSPVVYPLQDLLTASPSYAG